MSIIQEALKKAQYDYAGKKSLSQKHNEPGEKPVISVPTESRAARVTIKKTAFVIPIIALLVLVAGFGIRALFLKIATVHKERRVRGLIAAAQKTKPDKAASTSTSSSVVERATKKLLALVSSGQTNQPPSLVLNGIMYIQGSPKAIINGTVVREGDVISGATVTSITENNVQLKYNNDDNKVEVALKLRE